MKLDRVVIAIDFSERSVAAAQWASRAIAPQSELSLVHVLELPPPPAFLRRRFPLRADDIETYRTGGLVRLRQLGRQLGGRAIREEVRIGRADEEVVRVARERDADLIVVGSHRERPGFWNRFGSTAERILSGSQVPVLVVHGVPRSVPRLLLAAVDDTTTGLSVVAHANALAERLGASGRVMHVLPHHPLLHFSAPGELLVRGDEIVEGEKELMRATYDWLAERVGGAPNGLTPAVQQGEPADVILREARLAGVDLLVLGRERRSAVRRHLLGSVTSTVLRGANCPVLVIPSGSSEREDAVEHVAAATGADDEHALSGAAS